VTSELTEDFLRCFRELPARIKSQARKNYRRWKKDPAHPGSTQSRQGNGWHLLGSFGIGDVRWVSWNVKPLHGFGSLARRIRQELKSFDLRPRRRDCPFFDLQSSRFWTRSSRRAVPQRTLVHRAWHG
jgi:hypothetical protein